jgi:uncharacterized protein involved in exopolysaccharide biosynthesis
MTAEPLTLAALLARTLGRWRAAIGVASATVVLALVLSLVVPPSYRATASFVTTDAGLKMNMGGLSNLEAEPGLAGIASQFGLGSGRDPSESPAFYDQLLSSRELLTRLLLSRFADPRSAGDADSLTLLAILRIRDDDSQRALETAVKQLRRKTRVRFDLKTNLVVLTIDTRWSRLSADVANRAVALVSAFNKEQRLSRARARGDFLATRVDAAQSELRAEEDSQRLFYERNRSWQNSPALMVEERRWRRRVETANTLYLSLRQQYETARIDEVNTTPLITVVDQAVPARQRQWPRRTLIVLTAAFLGGVLGVLWAAARELFTHWARHNPDEMAMLRDSATQVRQEVRGAFQRPARRAAGRPTG